LFISMIGLQGGSVLLTITVDMNVQTFTFSFCSWTS